MKNGLTFGSGTINGSGLGKIKAAVAAFIL